MEDNEKIEKVLSESPETDIVAEKESSEKMQQERQALKKECASLYDRLLRKQAELSNYKKQLEREKTESVQVVSPDLIRELLPVMDSFELALRNAASEDNGDENMLSGFELIYKQLQDNLGRVGVNAIDATGQK